uniref:SLC26A/SulP transporter domain-containing protein n=1 Tax=Strigamia maritima TaxID=126957 RepID=T1JAD8_STRMM
MHLPSGCSIHKIETLFRTESTKSRGDGGGGFGPRRSVSMTQAQLQDASIAMRIKKWGRGCCTKKTLKKYVPMVNWLPEYNMSKFQSDAIAGITVGLTVIPQGMAYASVAELPLQYGLYSAFMACFVYCIFGGTKQVTIGPTAIMGLLTADQVRIGGQPYAVTLCFLTGVFEFLFGLFHLGFLIDFISAPVISGFTSAAAIIIGATQLKGLLGVKIKANHFLGVMYEIAIHITETNLWDLFLGIICIVLLLLMRKLNSVRWKSESTHALHKVLRKFIWFLSTGRNAIIVILAGGLAFLLAQLDTNVFTITGPVQGGIPSLTFPDLSLKNNETISFVEVVTDLGSSLGLIPLLAILEHIAIAKIFAEGKALDASQEILSLGLSNILGSFVNSFPATGSFSRTALNNSSGVETAFGGIFTGALVLLALGVLTTSFKFIPKSTLSAVIITTVFFMIEYEMVPHLWKTKKSDFFILIITFFSCIFLGAEYGILVGIGISLLILLYNNARPTITVEKTSLPNVEYIIVQPDRALYFPATDYLKYRVNKMASVNSELPVVFDGSHLTGPDFTIAQS